MFAQERTHHTKENSISLRCYIAFEFYIADKRRLGICFYTVLALFCKRKLCCKISCLLNQKKIEVKSELVNDSELSVNAVDLGEQVSI